MAVYQLSGAPIAWAPGEMYGDGAILIEPPEEVVERYGDRLERLDDNSGRLSDTTLARLSYADLRQLAAGTDDSAPINGNSKREDIYDYFRREPDESHVDELEAALEAEAEAEDDGERGTADAHTRGPTDLGAEDAADTEPLDEEGEE